MEREASFTVSRRRRLARTRPPRGARWTGTASGGMSCARSPGVASAPARDRAEESRLSRDARLARSTAISPTDWSGGG
jgi:hypothetical protein